MKADPGPEPAALWPLCKYDKQGLTGISKRSPGKRPGLSSCHKRIEIIPDFDRLDAKHKKRNPPMPKDLLLEIGTEEIPASFIPRALGLLSGILKKNIEAKRLSFKGIRTLGTPRRLAFIVEGLDERQADASIEARGPQTRAAYDANGKPTGALLGFLKSQSAEEKDIKTVKTDKGEYVSVIKELRGEETSSILPSILVETLSQEFFPKAMRWGSYDLTFARPIHSILSIFGDKAIPFELGHIKSSCATFGHRFLAPGGPIPVDGVASYLDRLRGAWVIADIEERKNLIREGVVASAREADGEIIPDEGLLDEVTCLVEYPVILRGSFDKVFLELPADVVVNAMREHQRYFSVVDPGGNLLPCFITVANTLAKDMSVVRKGNERVLRARLNDAKFYFEKDSRKKLSEMAEALRGVVFQAKLGTSYEKIERFSSLAVNIGAMTGFSRPLETNETPADFLADSFNPASYDIASIDPGLYAKFVLARGSMLAKADLTSGVVGEFPKLQGIMGSHYAKRGGETDEISVAIYEHYLPTASGGLLPASVPGAIISIADKVDTICGCFSVGLVPTGTQDPYALRRQALGIIAIILDKSFGLPIDRLIDESLDLLEKKRTRERAEIRSLVIEFFKERLKNQLLGQGLSFDSIDAVLSAPWYDIVDSVKRINALESFKSHSACASLASAFKRVSNILKGFEPDGSAPDQGLFTEQQEKALFSAMTGAAPLIDSACASGNYTAAFEALASIRETIDGFFDKVMVMADDASVRQNRLKLLDSVRSLYFRMADLSKLVI